jgi:hypothetical protein
MYVWGLISRTARSATVPDAIRNSHSRRHTPSDHVAARWSASQKPALWRVSAYSEPGLPRPRIVRSGYSSSASSSAFGFRISSGSDVASSPGTAATASVLGGTTVQIGWFGSARISTLSSVISRT